jgi:membrane protein
VTAHTKAAWLTVRRSLITIYNDVYDEHLFVFAAGLSYYFVLSLFPLLVSMASLLGYVPIPHLFEGLLSLMAKLVPGDGMSLVRNIVSDVNNKHIHFLTLGPSLHHLDSFERICCDNRWP